MMLEDSAIRLVSAVPTLWYEQRDRQMGTSGAFIQIIVQAPASIVSFCFPESLGNWYEMREERERRD
jgi:hypothetical protein